MPMNPELIGKLYEWNWSAVHGVFYNADAMRE